MGKKCFVPGCKSGYITSIKANKAAGKRNPSLFFAPKDPVAFENWRKIIPREDREFTRRSLICELHFLPKDIITERTIIYNDGIVEKVEGGVSRYRLRKEAVPCIFTNLPAYLSDHIREKKKALMKEFVEASRRTNSEASMETNSEGIMKTNSEGIMKTNSEGIMKTNSEASMKTNSEASGKTHSEASGKTHSESNWKTYSEANRKTYSEASWKRCPEANRKTYSKACRKENSETEAMDMNRIEETDVDEEEIRPINTNILSNSFQNNTNNRPSIMLKELSVSVTDLNSMRSTSDNSFFVLEGLQSSRNIESSTTFSNFDFKYLSENLNMIKKPSKWWIITPFEDCIICAKWNTEYVTERRIVIARDLKVKVFLKDSKVDVASGRRVESLDNVSFLLNEVDNLYLCAGLTDESTPEKKCLLYFERKLISGVENNLCCECRKWQKQEALVKSQQAKRIFERKERVKLYQARITSERRKNVRLMRKVFRLKQLVEFLKKDHIDSRKWRK